jgi:hypothetical protein
MTMKPSTRNKIYGVNRNRRQCKKKGYDPDRYGVNYKQICANTHQSTRSTCCICFAESDPAFPNQVHHAMYRDAYGKIKDREIPGIHVFSLCPYCHETKAHSPANWIRNPDKSYNRNTLAFYRRLKAGFTILNN